MNNQDKAIYAILADNVYWDVRSANNTGTKENPDFTNANWTPVPNGWTVIDEVSGSGEQGKAKYPELEGFTAWVFKS